MMTKKNKADIVRVAVGIGLLVLAKLLPSLGIMPEKAGTIAAVVLFAASYLTVGGDVLWRALRNIANGQVFDENFLMSIATVGAFALADYTEAVAVMLFYQIGEFFQSIAVNRSRSSIASLMDIRPDFANVEKNGELVRVDPEEVAVGDIIVIKTGERVPLDGVILEGASQLNTAALTGESLPREAAQGDDILSGSINLTGLLRVRVTKPFGESTVARILELVENAGDNKARAENFITRFARWYTPAVVAAAALLAVLPPLFFAQPWDRWIERGLIFLVVSCPCALVISVPLSFFGGIGGTSKLGILVKGGNYLEALERAGTVVFDKTGTLTQGSFSVVAIHPEKISGERLLELTAYAEGYSNHPISLSVQKAYSRAIERDRIGGVTETAGHGVRATVDGLDVLAGNYKLMEENGVPYHECHVLGTAIHVAVNGEYAGHIIIADEPKPDAKQAIEALKALGVKKTVMLTGDRDAVAAQTAQALGLDEYHAELLPQDKVTVLERLIAEKKPGTEVVFVGDGINDAPVLARADIGIAMGALGSDAAIEAADVVLMNDRPADIALAMSAAHRTMSIVRQNIGFALSVKAAVLLLSAFGIANMWWAVFADVGVTFIAVLNSMRALRMKDMKRP